MAGERYDHGMRRTAGHVPDVWGGGVGWRGLVGLMTLAALVLGVGCADIVGGGGNAGAKGTLVVLPTEGEVTPQLVHALDSALGDVKVPGINRTITSKVSIEVVQLSIGCVDPTPACYRAAARSLGGDHLIFARVQPADPKKKRLLRVTVSLFDVVRGGMAGEASRTYNTEDDAVHEVPRLIELVVPTETGTPQAKAAP
jgi:hypothetical protein